MLVIFPKGIPNCKISGSVASFGTFLRWTTRDVCDGEVDGDDVIDVLLFGVAALLLFVLLLLLLLTLLLLAFVLLLLLVVLLLLLLLFAVARLLLFWAAAAFSMRICKKVPILRTEGSTIAHATGAGWLQQFVSRSAPFVFGARSKRSSSLSIHRNRNY